MTDQEDSFNSTRAELFEALGHPTRVKILRTLDGRSLGFSELKREAGLESGGHLQFHLGKLHHLVQTNAQGSYALTDDGREAIMVLKSTGSDSETLRVSGGAIRKEGTGLNWQRTLMASLLIAIVLLSGVVLYQQQTNGIQMGVISNLQNHVADQAGVISRLQSQPANLTGVISRLQECQGADQPVVITCLNAAIDTLKTEISSLIARPNTTAPTSPNALTPTISAELSATNISAYRSVVDSAKLVGATGNAGGTVRYGYFSGGTCSGSETQVSLSYVTNGVVTNSTSRTFTAAGAYSWMAVYSGDANNKGATSQCEPLTVNPVVVLASLVGSNSIFNGNSSSFVASYSSLNVYASVSVMGGYGCDLNPCGKFVHWYLYQVGIRSPVCQGSVASSTRLSTHTTATRSTITVCSGLMIGATYFLSANAGASRFSSGWGVVVFDPS